MRHSVCRLGLYGPLGDIPSFVPETFAFSEKLLGQLGTGVRKKSP